MRQMQFFGENVKLQLRTTACLAACLLLGITGFSSPANASDSENSISVFNEAQLNEARSSMDDLGVSVQDQTRIIRNLENGILPDSLTGAAPVSQSQVETESEIRTTLVYADGSVTKNSMELPKPAALSDQPQTRTVDSCQQDISGAWIYYTGCRVNTSQVGFQLQFYAEVRVANGSNFYSTITRAYGASIGCSLCNSSSATAEILTATQTAGSAAKARGFAQLNFPFNSTTASVTLHVTYASFSDTSP